MKTFFTEIFLAYLRTCAKIQLKKIKPFIIGISGSAGKTSTMNAVYAILKDYRKCKYSIKANSETGIPLDILGLKVTSYKNSEWFKLAFKALGKLITNWEKYEVYIVELGVDGIEEPKNMKYLLKVLVPDLAIYLNVNTVHGSNYETRELLKGKKKLSRAENKLKNLLTLDPIAYGNHIKDLIADDKNLLIKALSSQGVAILNMDDPRVAKSKDDSKAAIYGIERLDPKMAEVVEQNHEMDRMRKFDPHANNTFYYFNEKNEGGFAFEFFANYTRYKINFSTLVLPRHYAVTFLNALAVSQYFKIDMESAIESLIANYKIEAGRSTLLKGIYNSTLIDSSYNSSKEPCEDMLELLSTYKAADLTGDKPKDSYRIAVLGDMRELGNNSKKEHEQLSEFAFTKADEFFLVGEEMKNYFAPRILELGLNQYKLHVFDTAGECSRELVAFLRENFEKRDLNHREKLYAEVKRNLSETMSPVILVKGSQNTIFLEIVVEQLLDNKDLADTVLCRRGEFWDKQRESYY